MHCPGCQVLVVIPDIGACRPPGTEVRCSCGDAIGVLYTDNGPLLAWWRPSRPVMARRIDD